MLILAGVLGGLLAFGLVGLFVGPVILAVTYTLLLAWVQPEGSRHRSAIALRPRGRPRLESAWRPCVSSSDLD